MAKITKIEVIWIRVPLKQTFVGSVYTVAEKSAVLTRIHADDGVIGECINGEGPASIHKEVVAILQGNMAMDLVGHDPDLIDTLWTACWAKTRMFNQARAAAVRAVACLDSALWDMKGKRANMPLYLLWGGARHKLPLIAIGGQYREGFTTADYGREIEEFRSLGIGGCKFKVGGRSIEEDAERTNVARRAGGDDFILCVDANRAWSREEAMAYWRKADHNNLRWFEEPCHWNNDRRDMAMLRSFAGIPIAAGQSEIAAEGCRDLMIEGAIDVCNFDASWGGGPTPWLRVAKAAACFGIEMAHHGEPIVGSHLLAAVENGTYAETHHPTRDPIFHQMVEGRGRIADGYYTMPSGPGWGVTYDPDFIAKYQAQ
jgi:D-galactarolactone cycloisomerase